MNRFQMTGPAALLRFARSFRKNRQGVAIVEFALAAPILLAVLAGITDGATLLLQQNAMHSGVSSSAQYIMSGGSDLSTARQIGLSSWEGRTEQADVTASKDCFCAVTPATCSVLCADQTVPQAYVKIAATDSFDGWFADTTLHAEQDVRIR